MTRQEKIIRAVIAETFNYPENLITRDTTADDVDGWDSLQHTVLMVRLENALGIALSEYVAESETVGQLIDRVETA